MSRTMITQETVGTKPTTSKASNLLETLFIHKKSSAQAEFGNQAAKEMIYNLYHAKRELEVAHNNFEFAKEQEEIDYYIYQMKAAETRYQYLLRKAKEINLNLSALDSSCLEN